MCFSFVRLYIVLRFILLISKFMNPRSIRVCVINGCSANHMFAMKAFMKQKPYVFISITLCVSIFLFGYTLKVFDGPLSEVSNQNFNILFNACWNVIITMTTTGYGDIYPKSNLGRLCGLIICFWGTFMTSFFVVTVSNMLTFSPSEEKSYTLLLRLYFKDELKDYAVKVVNSALKQHIVKVKYPEDQARKLSALRMYRGDILSFQQALDRVRSFYESDSEIDILMRLIENLRDDVVKVQNEQSEVRQMIETIAEYIQDNV